MQPSTPWQQPPPGQPYQDPPLDPSLGDLSQGHLYPEQPSAVPYPSQPSAVPFHARPAGAPYQGYGFQQSGPAVAYQPQPPSGAPAPPQGRNFWPIALSAGMVALIVIVIAIVAVTALQHGPGQAPQAASSPSRSRGPVDGCLVGRWQQTDYQRNVPLGDTDVGKREKLGTIKLTGSGKRWSIQADGSAMEDDNGTRYAGRAEDGREVVAQLSGSSTWALTTTDHKINFAGISGTTAVAIFVDGSQKGVIELEPNLDPTPYTCTGDVWRTTSAEDPNGFMTYQRVR